MVVGYDPFLHVFSFMFLAENRRVVIVGNSIIKNLPPIDDVVIKSFRGDTIAQLTNRIDKGQVDLSPFDYVIIHVGTNNIANQQPYDKIIADYGNLIPTIKKRKRSIRVIISAILPRPCDHEFTDPIIKDVNKCLRSAMGPDLGFHFIESWKAVSKFGTYSRYLFAKNDGGLHLNLEGSRRLRFFFLRVISTID